MPRIYKAIKPSSNKAMTPVKETKTTEPVTSPKDDKKKDGGGE